MPVIDQRTAAPTNKMAAVGISGAVTVLVLALVEALTNVSVSSEVASALTLVISFGMGYLTKESI